jgi:hypothetical protein
MLVLFPLFAVAALLAALALTPAAAHASVYNVEIELAKSCGLVGCALAGFRFGRRDYLRIAWLLLGACYLLILANDFLFRAGGLLAGRPWTTAASGTLILVANASQLAGSVMIARVWRVAGFELAGSRRVQRLVQLGAIAFALATAGYFTFTSTRAVIGGDLGALVDAASSIGDMIGFALIAPFLLTAVALRGGSLGWTWGLLTASLIGWLLFDAALAYTPWLLDAGGTKALSEIFRLLACTLALGAGLAQRWAVRGLPARAGAGDRAVA